MNDNIVRCVGIIVLTLMLIMGCIGLIATIVKFIQTFKEDV